MKTAYPARFAPSPFFPASGASVAAHVKPHSLPIILFFVLAAVRLPAADYFWDAGTVVVDGVSAGGSGSWIVGGSGWEDGSEARNWADSNTAVLAGTGGTLTLGGHIAASGVIVVSGTHHVTGSYWFYGGAINIAADSVLSLENSARYDDLNFSSLSGAGTLVIDKSQSSYITSMTGANGLNFTGLLQLRGGTVGSYNFSLGNKDLTLTQASGTSFALDTGASGTDCKDFYLTGYGWGGRPDGNNQTLNLSSLTGYGYIAAGSPGDGYGWSVTYRVGVNQSENTTFNGGLRASTGSSVNYVQQSSLAFTKDGTGELAIAGVVQRAVYKDVQAADVFLTVNGGKLILTNPANSTQGSVTIGANGTLEVSGSGVLGGSGTFSGSISNAGDLLIASSASQTFSGILSGAGALDKSGMGTLTLSNSNSSYSGEISVSGGILKAGTSASFGTGGIFISGGGTLDLNGHAVGNSITSTGGTLLNATSYTGTLGGTVNGIFDAGTDANKTYLIADTGVTYATLLGQGTFSGGRVTVTGEHNPGNSAGTQTFDNGLTYAAGAIVNLQIDANGLLYDSIGVNNGLIIGDNVTLNIGLAGIIDYADEFWDEDHMYRMLLWDVPTGWFETVNNNISTTSEGVWGVLQDGEELTVTWNAIPEPSSICYILGALTFGAFFLRGQHRCTAGGKE